MLVSYFYDPGISTVHSWKMSLDPTPKQTSFAISFELACGQTPGWWNVVQSSAGKYGPP